MNTLTKFFNPFLNNSFADAKYEVIENEVLASCNFKELTISGSLFSLTTFKNVTFESCVFFASKLENCHFLNCKFLNCDFQFTSIEHCNLKATSFRNCKWDITPLRKNIFENCLLDDKTFYFTTKSNSLNKLVNCQRHDNLVHQNKKTEPPFSLPPLPYEEEALVSYAMGGEEAA